MMKTIGRILALSLLLLGTTHSVSASSVVVLDLFEFALHWGESGHTPSDLLSLCGDEEAVDSFVVDIPNLPVSARPMRMIRIPAGSFMMGNTEHPRDMICSTTDCSQELPRHQVDIGYDFYLGETEVTQAQWEALMGNNPAGTGPNIPVYWVEWWQDIVRPGQFLDKLSALGPGTFRLPSEAEWEYACGGTEANEHRYAPFSFGDDTLFDLESCEFNGLFDRHMVYCGNDIGKSEEVATKLPNSYGLYDMHGNVWELCQDRWHENYVGAPTDGSAWETTYSARVKRGGFWDGKTFVCRSAYRSWNQSAHHTVGLRVAMNASR